MTCPAVLVETAFLSNANERQLLITDKWQEEIASRLFKAFKEYKSIYDGSVTGSPDIAAVEAPVEKPVEEQPAAVKDAPNEYYGIQIMGLGRLLSNGDKALKGLAVQPVKADDSNIYKYVHGVYASKGEASSSLAEVKKKFPEAFVVKVSGNTVIRVK